MKKEVVVTGLGVLSSIGITVEQYWTALCDGTSGIGYLQMNGSGPDEKYVGSAVPEFSPKDYIKPKKNIKVMSRDIQLAFVAVAHACQNANLQVEGDSRSVAPERMGVIFGSDLIGLDLNELTDAFKKGIDENGNYDFATWGQASMEKIQPLWMLKYLPNMPACHIGIALDARGPNNTPTLERCSCLSALIEAARVIERGDADVMVCGGCGNKVNPSQFVHQKALGASLRTDDPTSILRPYDVDRSGTVLGEGAGAFVLESREFAEARGAKPLATFLGAARSSHAGIKRGADTEAISQNIRLALNDAGLTAGDLDHINAEGLGMIEDDAQEAVAIRDALGDLPVFSAKGHVGNLGSGAGAVELVASLAGLQKGIMPATRNCVRIADDCPVNVIKDGIHTVSKPAFIKISHSNMGRSVAVLFGKE